MKTKKTLLLSALAGFGLLALVPAQRKLPAPYRLFASIAVGGQGGWDFLATDPAGERLYVAHGSQVEVLDLKTHKVVGTVPGTPGAHGVVAIPAVGRGYASCGRNNTVVAFDLKTLQNLGTTATGPKPDALLYDAFSKRLFAFSNEGGSSSVLDPATGQELGRVELGGDVEVGVSDGQGHIFVNIEDKSEVVEFDARSLAVLHHYPLAPGEEPTGLAFDVERHRLFSGCANGKLVVLDSRDGHRVAVKPIGRGVDGVAFDAATHHVIATNGADGTMTVIHQFKDTLYAVVATVPTAKGARTVALNPRNHHLYTCTADLGPAPAATTDSPHPRPAIVPGTFRVLDFGQ